MSDPAADDYEWLLEALMAGDISPDDRRVRRVMSKSEELRRRWVALQRLQSCLRYEDEEREEILRDLCEAFGD